MPRGPILIPLVSRPASGPAGTACQAPTTGRGGAGERTRTSTPWGDRDLNPARLPVPPRPRPRQPSWAALPAGTEGCRPGANLPGVMAPDPGLAQLQLAGYDRSADVYQRLLKERIVFLGTQVDTSSANLICAQLLLLEAEDPDRDIALYINSPGGSVTDGLAIYDTMQYVRCDVATICVGLAASMGQFLLCAGAPGKRYALPHSRILMHQPSGQMQGQAADIAIQAEQIVFLKRMMAERIAYHTGQPVERIEADSDRDRWFTADEAKEYGFIDQVISRARQVGDRATA